MLHETNFYLPTSRTSKCTGQRYSFIAVACLKKKKNKERSNTPTSVIRSAIKIYLFNPIMCRKKLSQFLMLCAQVFEFSLGQKEYTDWSRKLQKQGLHPLWLERDTPITHITFNRKNPAHIILHDVFMLCVIDQSLVCTL